MTAMTGSSRKAVVTLPTDTQIRITREFAAPRELVYRAWTTPDLIKRWWGGKRGVVTLAEVDLRVGGRWRYVTMTNRGFEIAFHGEFHEIVHNERLVYTEVFEGVPEGEEPPPLVTLTLTESNGRTLLTSITEVPSRAVRDTIIESGMEAGMQEVMDVLEEVAISLG